MQISTRDYFLCRCIFKTERAYGSIFGGASFVQLIPSEQKPRYTNQNDTFLHFLLIVQIQKVSWFKFRNQQ